VSTPPITVAVLGTGPVADLVARRVEARPDLALAGSTPSTEAPPAGTACVVYLPTCAELASGAATERVVGLLRAGFDVVSTAPAAALSPPDLIHACQEGASSFHGTGGFQSSLAVRFNRAFASITRDVRRVELLEELDVEDPPAHPWTVPADLGLEDADPQAVTGRAATLEGYYDAALRTLSDAVFGDTHADEEIVFSAARAHRGDALQRQSARAEATAEPVVVRRDLGAHAAYDSVWTKREGSTAPLRYQLKTETGDAVGRVTLTFHAEGAVRPADHLTSVGLLDAIVAVHRSAPGILHHDLDIYHVAPDERLMR